MLSDDIAMIGAVSVIVHRPTYQRDGSSGLALSTILADPQETDHVGHHFPQDHRPPDSGEHRL